MLIIDAIGEKNIIILFFELHITDCKRINAIIGIAIGGLLRFIWIT